MFKNKKPYVRLTAAEARKMSGPTVEQQVDEALKEVEKYAKNGKRSMELRGRLWGDDNLEWRSAFDQLTSLGYKVSFNEMGDSDHFADPHTTISW